MDGMTSDGAMAALDAPALPAVTGTWWAAAGYGPTRDDYRMTLAIGGGLVIQRQRDDEYGPFINCRLIETLTGTWSLDASQFTVTLASGTTARVEGIGTLTCDAADLYAERPMSSTEIVAHDYFSGPYRIDAGRLAVTTPSFAWTWQRE